MPLQSNVRLLFALFVFNLCASLLAHRVPHSLPSNQFVPLHSGNAFLPSPHHVSDAFGPLELLIASETNRNHYHKASKQSRASRTDYSAGGKGSLVDSGLTGSNLDQSSASRYIATPAAVQTTKHLIDVKEVDLDSEPFSPQTVIVDATVMPLTIYFRSTSSMVKVIQEHMEGKGDVQHTQSEEEPHRLFHEVHKPIIQEVHEVIKPYRRIIQEMQPVYQDVKTIISRPFEGGKDSQERTGYELTAAPYQRNRFVANEDTLGGYVNSNMNNFEEDFMRITQAINHKKAPQSPSSVNFTSTKSPKAQSTDYASEVTSSNQASGVSAYDRVPSNSEVPNERSERDNTGDSVSATRSSVAPDTSVSKQVSDLSNNSNSTTSSPVGVQTVALINATAKRKRQHRTSTPSKVSSGTRKTLKNASPQVVVNSKDSPIGGDLTRSRRLAIKRLVNKIDREKRKIRLGFFGIYGINLIPYIYDQFAYDVKIRVPPGSSDT